MWTGRSSSRASVSSTRRCAPAATSRSLDFATRNLYRGAIEKLARGSKLTELQIAQATLDVAREQDPRCRGAGARPGLSPDRIGAARVREGDRLSRLDLGRVGRFNTTVGALDYIGGVLLVAALVEIVALLALDSSAHLGARLAFFAFLAADPRDRHRGRAVESRGHAARSRRRVLPALALREGVPPRSCAR